MTVHLHYDLMGDESKPAMLLIHGFLTSNLQWILNQDALSEHFYLIMVETWGHGSSPTPTDPERYSADGYILELERIRVSLGVEKWLMIGQSFGAGVVLSYALRHPERLYGLAFTNSRSAIGELSTTDRRIPKEAFDNMRALPMHPINAKRLDEDLKARLVAIADAVDPIAARLGAENGHTMACREKIRNLQVPALLCNGTYEEAFQKDVEFAGRALPSLRVANLEAGHSTNLDAPQAFNSAVLNFCAELLC